jgi:hypothetical protein
MLSSHLQLGLPSGVFLSGFPVKTLYMFLFASMRATCTAHFMLTGIDNACKTERKLKAIHEAHKCYRSVNGVHWKMRVPVSPEYPIPVISTWPTGESPDLIPSTTSLHNTVPSILSSRLLLGLPSESFPNFLPCRMLSSVFPPELSVKSR